MKALISTIENAYDYEGNVLGLRVAQLNETEFEVHSTLFWIDCDLIDCLVDDMYYSDGNLYRKPVRPEPINPESEANTDIGTIV